MNTAPAPVPSTPATAASLSHSPHGGVFATALALVLRYRWLCGAAVLAAALLGVVLAQSAPVAAPSGSSLALSAQVVGPAGSANVGSTNTAGAGDEIQFTAQIAQPTSTPSNTDGYITLPPNFAWRTGSVLAPPTATDFKWNIGQAESPPNKAGSNWVSTEPAQGTKVSQFAWVNKPFVTLEVKPLAAPTVNFQGTGDGYRIFTYKNTAAGFEKDNLYVLNHHTANSYLNCRTANTGQPCAGFANGGLSASRNNNVALAANLEPAFLTPNRNIEHLNSATGEVFFYTGDDKGDIRVLCINLNTLKSCTDATVIGKSLLTNQYAISPIGSIANKFYAINTNGEMLCYDTFSKASCASTYPVKTKAYKVGAQSVNSVSATLVLNSKLLYIDDVQKSIACFDTIIMKDCAEVGWVNNPKSAAQYGIFPVLNPDGTIKGACSTTDCRTLIGDIFYPSFNSAYQNFLNANQMFTSNGTWSQANYFGTQVYHNLSTNMANFANCFDFKTNAICAGFPINNPTGEEVRIYAVTKDTVRPNCMWAIGDPAIARSFDPRDGGVCRGVFGIPTEINLTVDPQKNMQCDSSKTPNRGWKTIRFSKNLPWGAGALSDMVVTIKDGNNNLIASAPNRKFASGTYELDISDIPYATYPKLNIVLTPQTGDAALTAAVGFDVTWDSDPAQVCIKAQAPALAICTPLVAAADTSAAPVYSATPVAPEQLHADQASTTGGKRDGVGPGASSTTLVQRLSGGSDPTQILQTRFDMGNFTGDLWQFKLAGFNKIDPTVVAKASTAPANASNYYTSTGGTAPVRLSYANLSAPHKAMVDQTVAGKVDGKGAQRIAYMAGGRTDEAVAGAAGFRPRASLLGPVIDSSPAVLPTSALLGYSDYQFPHYNTFRKDKVRASKMVFYNGNDNLLHAYAVGSAGLTEAFKFLPSIALADVPRYTDSTAQQVRLNPYFMDNTPMVAHVNLAASRAGDEWRSVVVANRGRGGRGLFALDVTSGGSAPDKVLFEYSNTTPANTEGSLSDLGYALGQPIMDTVAGGEQVVRVRAGTDGKEARWAYITGNGVGGESGKDNRPCTASNTPCTQKAVLYIVYLNGNTAGGKRWERLPVIADPASGAVPDADLHFGNGLSTPRPVDLDNDGVVDLVYAGDVKGNLWRFDLRKLHEGTGSSGTGLLPTKLFATTGGQAIHTAPVVQSFYGDGTCSVKFDPVSKLANFCQMVVFATGQDTNALKPILPGKAADPMQRLYGIFDKGDSTTVLPSLLAVQGVSTTAPAAANNGFSYRSTSDSALDYKAGQRGWQLALPRDEHNTANPVLQSDGTVLFATRKPTLSVPCFESWLTQVSVRSGGGTKILGVGGTGNSVKLPEQAGSTVPESLGGSSLNGTASGLLINPEAPATSPTSTLAQSVSKMIGRLSWREVFGANKN